MVKHTCRPCPRPPCPCARRARYAPPKVEVLHDGFPFRARAGRLSLVDSLFINKVLASHVVFAVSILHLLKTTGNAGGQRGGGRPSPCSGRYILLCSESLHRVTTPLLLLMHVAWG